MVGPCYSGHYSIEDKCIITLKGVKLGTYKFKIFLILTIFFKKSRKNLPNPLNLQSKQLQN